MKSIKTILTFLLTCMFAFSLVSASVTRVDNVVSVGTEINYTGIKPGESKTYDSEKEAYHANLEDSKLDLQYRGKPYNPPLTIENFTINQLESSTRSTQIEVYACTDSWGYESSFNVCLADDSWCAYDPSYTNMANNTCISAFLDLDDGDYTIDMYDTYNDGGLCAGVHIPNVTSLLPNNTCMSGGAESFSFSIGGAIATCDDDAACNTGAEADCTYANSGEDCDGNCLADSPADCAGVCGGSSVNDECGVCDGPGTVNGFACDGTCDANTVNVLIGDSYGDGNAACVTIDGVGTVCGATGSGTDYNYCLDFGDYTFSVENNETYTNETQITISWNGVTLFYGSGYSYGSGQGVIATGTFSLVDAVYGCMDVAGCNYDSAATADGGCEYPPAGYDCAGACIGDADYGCGCTDFWANNNSAETVYTDNASCDYAGRAALNWNLTSGSSFGSEIRHYICDPGGANCYGYTGVPNSTSNDMLIHIVEGQAYEVWSADSYGDGWQGGFWSISDLDGNLIAGEDASVTDGFTTGMEYSIVSLSVCTAGYGCDDVCGSGLVDDSCGVCDGDDSPNTGTCDCAGTPSGDAVADNCGTCDADSSNDCIADCAGVFEGDEGYGSVEDICGVCNGDGTSCCDDCGVCDTDNDNNNLCADCTGEPNGNAFINDDGYCVYPAFDAIGDLVATGSDDVAGPHINLTWSSVDGNVDSDEDGNPDTYYNVYVFDPAYMPDCMGNQSYIGDGYCDTSTNNEGCAWDGGDCCPGDCVDANYSCNSYGGDCNTCLNTASADWADGGECANAPVCGDGVCDTEGGESAGDYGCYADCGCVEGEFDCGADADGWYGNCISASWVCDNASDCGSNGLDEADCGEITCADIGQASCTDPDDGSECIYTSWVCDGGTPDCSNGSDEEGCPTYSAGDWCDYGGGDGIIGCDASSCLPASWINDAWCDWNLDCGLDGSDCDPMPSSSGSDLSEEMLIEKFMIGQKLTKQQAQAMVDGILNQNIPVTHDNGDEYSIVKNIPGAFIPDWQVKNGLAPVNTSNRTTEGFNVYRDATLVGQSYATSYVVSDGGAGCYSVSAFDSSPVYESGLSNDACVDAPNPCVVGDATNDGTVNVADIVSLVGAILNNGGSSDGVECGDIDGGGVINVSDIVAVVNIILNPIALTNTSNATEAKLNISNDVSIIANGQISAIQMVLSHDSDFSLELTQDAWVADYATSDNKTTLIVIMPNSEYLFTPNGEFTIEETLVLGLENEIDVNINTIPFEFSVSDAYPNPFNPVTALNINLPEDNLVKVSVYNVTGQMVDAVFSSNLAAGTHSITWDAGNLSSGVYLIRTEAGKNISIQKVMLLK